VAPDSPDEFRHRMLVNIAGFCLAGTLTLAAVWLAVALADIRHTQECVLSGRRDCAPIVPAGRLAAAGQH
jgi:hypothetical protein